MAKGTKKPVSNVDRKKIRHLQEASDEQHLGTMSIAAVQTALLEHAAARGSVQDSPGPETIPAVLASIHRDLSLGLVEYEAGRLGLRFDDEGVPSGLPVALASAVGGIFVLAELLRIDLGNVLNVKYKFDVDRPIPKK